MPSSLMLTCRRCKKARSGHAVSGIANTSSPSLARSTTDVPLHTPLEHVSPIVQLSPSSQLLPSGSPRPTHAPAKQLSWVVHRSPSSQATPLINGSWAQPSLVQTSAVQGLSSSQAVSFSTNRHSPSVWRQRSRVHTLLSLQLFWRPRQTPLWHTASMMQRSAGSHERPSSKGWVHELVSGSKTSAVQSLPSSQEGRSVASNRTGIRSSGLRRASEAMIRVPVYTPTVSARAPTRRAKL